MTGTGPGVNLKHGVTEMLYPFLEKITEVLPAVSLKKRCCISTLAPSLFVFHHFFDVQPLCAVLFASRNRNGKNPLVCHYPIFYHSLSVRDTNPA